MKDERNIEYVEVLEVLAHEDCSATNKADVMRWCIEIISVLFSKTFFQHYTDTFMITVVWIM